MNVKMLAYSPADTPVHKLTGAAKLIFFVLWSMTAMITFDTRLLLGMLVFSLIVVKVSRIRFRDFSFVLTLILIFMLLNHVAIFLFSPHEGTHIYGTRHTLFPLVGWYTVTLEQLFYQFNLLLKYGVVIPMALVFVLTTDPSEFAASLHRVGLSYRIAFSVAIAMRYIPDVQRDFQNIAFSAQARGLDMSRKAKLLNRLRNIVSILLPLIMTSIERIEKISAAMELRGFGRHRTRTWYKARPFSGGDFAAVALVVLVALAALWSAWLNGSRFYNVFRL